MTFVPVHNYLTQELGCFPYIYDFAAVCCFWVMLTDLQMEGASADTLSF